MAMQNYDLNYEVFNLYHEKDMQCSPHNSNSDNLNSRLLQSCNKVV